MRTPTMSTQLSMRCFRALRRSSALVAGALLAACNDPPAVCDRIADQELFTGEEVLLEPCFEDPEGEELTLAATSSEEPVATAQVYDLEVNIQAISPGDADVTVTATDPGRAERLARHRSPCPEPAATRRWRALRHRDAR